MQRELVGLYNRLYVVPTAPSTARSSRAVKVKPAHVSALNTEVAMFGYTFDAQLILHLRHLGPVHFSGYRELVLDVLREVSGSHVQHRALFNKFPYDVPNDREYLVKRVIGHIQTLLDFRSNQSQVLECGHVLDERLFNLDDYGACPICQYQVAEAEAHENILYEFKRLTPLKILAPADVAYIRQIGSDLLARPSSLSAAERSLLDKVRDFGGFRQPRRMFKENLPFAYTFFQNVDYISKQLSGATDVLRIAVYLSDRAADLSLKEPTRFKELKARQRRDLLKLLESRKDISEDILRHRERWLRLGEVLHPGGRRNARRYPRVAAAFDKLRNHPETIPSFNRVVERGLRSSTIDGAMLRMLAKRPGEYLRRLDALLRKAKKPELVLEYLEEAANSDAAPTKLLFEVQKYLSHRRMAPLVPARRLFVPKGPSNRLYAREDNRPVIDDELLRQAYAIVDNALVNHVEANDKLEPWGKVYVDPALMRMLVPYNRRGDSNATAQMVKGQRYPLPLSDVIRLFVWWKGPVDVDLSIACFTNEFKFVGEVSFMQLRWRKAIHSGDIQNGSRGASEFIDFDVMDMRYNSVRYIMMTVVSYRGDAFTGFPCFAGFMARDGLKSGAKYEPESVQIKFDLNSNTRSYMPLVFDLGEREVIFTDMAATARRFSYISGMQSNLLPILQSMLTLPDRKVTVADVLVVHATARGKLVDKPEQADRVFEPTNINMEEIISLMSV